MSSSSSNFWNETAGICTIIGLILGTCLAALTLYFTWRQSRRLMAHHEPREQFKGGHHEPTGSNEKILDDNMEQPPLPKQKSFYWLIALIVAAIISFSATVALAANIPRIQALHSSTSQSTSLPTRTNNSHPPSSTPIAPTTTFSVPAASAPTSFPTNYHNIGCYRDSSNPRVLNASGTYTSSMTVPGCVEFCENYTYFGTEYGIQCFCGNDFPHSFHAADSFCNSTCAGNSSEYCGGDYYLSLGTVGT